MDDLHKLDVTDLSGVAAVHFQRKGFSSHAEVICQIKGIPLVQVDELVFTQDAVISWPERAPISLAAHLCAFQGKFQAVIFDSSDLATLDFDRIDTVFVRFEHLLYGAIARVRQVVDSITDLRESIHAELLLIARALPYGVTLLVRGVDVRSDDRVLAGLFFGESEVNPELGEHGTRYLLNRPHLVNFMADVLRDLPAEVRFACPFVTSYREYSEFLEKFSEMFRLPLIPFAESPAIFNEIRKYNVDKLCIGLKDVAQFYFAADRANPDVADAISYIDEGLLSVVAKTVRKAASQGIEVHLYQRSDIFALYNTTLTGVNWVPSLAASELASRK